VGSKPLIIQGSLDSPAAVPLDAAGNAMQPCVPGDIAFFLGEPEREVLRITPGDGDKPGKFIINGDQETEDVHRVYAALARWVQAMEPPCM